MIIIGKARRKALLVLNVNLGFPEKRKLYPVCFFSKHGVLSLRAQCSGWRKCRVYHFTGEAFQGFLEILMGQDKMSALSRSLVALKGFLMGMRRNSHTRESQSLCEQRVLQWDRAAGLQARCRAQHREMAVSKRDSSVVGSSLWEQSYGNLRGCFPC